MNKILAINPGSTSTKIALFQDDVLEFSVNLDLNDIHYDANDGRLILCSLVEKVVREVTNREYRLDEIDVFIGRGGRMTSCAGGIYEIDERMLAENKIENGNVHPLTYSPWVVKQLSEKFGGRAYVLNSQSVDEFADVARVTGYCGVWRHKGLHALNHKQVGTLMARELGRPYDEVNVIVAHLGGGISVVAHEKGRMIDFSGGGGEGPMAPTRSGTVACADVIKLAFSGKYTLAELNGMTSMKGGLTAHLGTADAREVEKRISDGDEYAKLVYDAMIYQISKEIGAMAVAMRGHVDGIALTGGLANSQYLSDNIRAQTEWIAPLKCFPGEYEMECLGQSAFRALTGQEPVQIYTGKPVFDAALWAEKRSASLKSAQK